MPDPATERLQGIFTQMAEWINTTPPYLLPLATGFLPALIELARAKQQQAAIPGPPAPAGAGGRVAESAAGRRAVRGQRGEDPPHGEEGRPSPWAPRRTVRYKAGDLDRLIGSRKNGGR